MRPPALGSSFRDPSGFVYVDEEGTVRRQVNEVYRSHYEHLMGSGLYTQLVETGLLVSHVEEPGSTPDAFKALVPEQVPFISYPYEWCFSQLKDAALATLSIQDMALDHGMSLRDASAYNIQFLRGKPTLIDTLSFEVLREGSPWVAYGQFCRHFLAPLALMSMTDVTLGQLSRVHLDGVPLGLASALLPGRARLRPSLQIHINAHARSQERHAEKSAPQGQSKRRFSMTAFRGLISSLRSALQNMEWKPSSHWANYYETNSYSEEGEADKSREVDSSIAAVAPATVWDLGANTGRYSRIAIERGAFTVSFDMDPASVEANYRSATADGLSSLLPLVVDLANPSPPIGWRNEERMSLKQRGPADLLLALALIHHLAIGNNVPFRQIAAAFAELGKALVVEFVPKSDPMVQHLLSSRDDIFSDYDRDAFEAAFADHFKIENRSTIRGSERTLYLMRTSQD